MFTWKCHVSCYYITSGPTPQVASSAAHMSAQANKEREKKRRKIKSVTTCPWEHKATGLTAHQHTYIHVLSYGGPKRWRRFQRFLHSCGRRRVSWVMAISSSSSLGTRQVSRCSCFANTKLPLASEVIYLHYIAWTHFPLTWGVYTKSYTMYIFTYFLHLVLTPPSNDV